MRRGIYSVPHFQEEHHDTLSRDDAALHATRHARRHRYQDSLKLFDVIKDQVFIKKKTIHHTPVEKLYDAFIAILAGAHGLCEINTRLRSDAPSVAHHAPSSRLCSRP
jgi:hypothetical protein